jgi:hypothetical protein
MGGRTIKLFLLDGTPMGVIAAEVMNWTGKVYLSPRAQLPVLKSRDEARRSGVYMLVGPDPEGSGKTRVYVGESDNVIGRIQQHDRDESKDFYERTVLVISKDEQLTKAHARYLENRLISLASVNGTALLTNDTRGAIDVRLPESDRADMEAFLEYVQIVLPVLGIGFTQPQLSAASLVATIAATGAGDTASGVSPMFVLSAAGAVGRAREITGQFLLLAGSTARKQATNSWTAYRSTRDQLVADGKLVDSVDDPACYIVREDIAFNSPSAAAAVVAARNMNGRQAWRTDQGETYQQWYERRLTAVPVPVDD